MGGTAPSATPLTRKDYASSAEVRWCPGCDDYAILVQLQKTFAEIGMPREKCVIVSGIGCSSRLPYYMNTYGFHSIHGRAPTLATGIKIYNPNLSVWVITGDGDGLSIGGNHLLHTLRKNVDIKILLFNNRIYGLTKGQYSPTSEYGKKTKTSPFGTVDYPVNPISFALGVGATFVARSVAGDPNLLGSILERAARHRGSAFVEIFQNCVIFNDEAFLPITERSVRPENTLLLEHGKPLIFGKDRTKGIRLKGTHIEAVTLGPEFKEPDLLVHNEKDEDPGYAFLLAQMELPKFPVPLGVFRAVERPTYDEMVRAQIDKAKKTMGEGDLKKLLFSGETWTVT